MHLPLRPPIEPMLGRLARELPVGDYVYEPKWDGFRCLAFRSDEDVELRSRHDRPLGRYFPELVRGLRDLPADGFVLDGEIVVPRREGFDFAALLGRVHPAASRVERLSRETPAMFMAFDLLALGCNDLRSRPFEERRSALERLLAEVEHPVALTPATGEASVAGEWLNRFQGAGIDGVVAKPRDLTYRPGARAMLKVKREHTADCVVAGFRWYVDRPLLSSLLLGLHDEAGELQHIGVATSFSARRRRELAKELLPLRAGLEGHPWQRGFLVGGSPMGRLAGAAGRWSPDEMALDWVPLAPVRVCEVAYDQVDARRLRHPARFRRWRPDREPESCTFEQLAVEPPVPAEVLAPR